MDEILIEDKKYISSKQAAKITGYAKDYVGQLCREGRVPARLVGRGWYVLESAIQDHRFGDIHTPEGVWTPTSDVVAEPIISHTWESPRYEASSKDLLPPLNRIKDVVVEASIDVQEEAELHIQDSWREWFDRFGTPEIIRDDTEAESEPKEREEMEEGEQEEQQEEAVPIHIYQPPPEEFLPRNEEEIKPAQEVMIRRRGRGSINKALQAAGIATAMIFAVLAVIGSGYLDKYILSNSQVSIIAGVTLYNK